ncbi:MAG: hypothetical protein K5790_08270 [Nitrosopumilus sp.]|nr:hypothetical protein [Nitrosopumilus sp.]MCV0393263.1 hypothetical protein [Nitrosopumilus sp.]
MIQSTLEKEDYLKDLVVKLLQEKNLSEFDKLELLFSEIKLELQTQE